jgi:RNA polymerase sigma factor (sigma-70 family)
MADTTVAVREYLRELQQVSSDSSAELIVRSLLSKACSRLSRVCSMHLSRHYPRLTQPPHNLEADELLSAAVERLIKALREVRPQDIRQFFALANRHIRWELNDLARRLDKRPAQTEYLERAAPEETESHLSFSARRILDAIDKLPDEEREVFELVRIQGLAHTEAAEILGVAPKTIQRRLGRALLQLSDQLADLSE